MPTSTNALVAALGVIATICAASCRPCAVVEEAWEERLNAEFAEVGTGETADSGVTDHLRLVLSAGALEYIVAPLAESEVFRPVATSTTFRANAASEVVVEGEMSARVIAVDVVAADELGRNVELTLDAIVSVEVDAIDRRPAYTTSAAQILVRAPLAFVAGEQGPALVVDLDGAVVADVAVDGTAMPEGYADVPTATVAGITTDMAERLVAAVDEPVRLLEWERLNLGWSELQLTASSIRVDTATGVIVLGAVTNLRPVGALAHSPPPAEYGFAVDLHPDLWRAAMVHMQAVGRMPRRFDDTGQPDVDGRYAVAVDAARLRHDGAAASMTLFCLRGRCDASSALATGEVSAGTAGLEVRLTPAGSTSEVVLAWTAAARDTLAALLQPPSLELAGDVPFDLLVGEVLPRDAGVRVRGNVLDAAR